MARYAGVTQWQVRNVWQAADVKPHRLKTFKLSRDPKFAEKVIDVVGLYLNPPDNALVLSVDEKTQIQALDRTHPMLPLRPGQVARRTHDYKRHGTANLYPAFNVATGEVLGRITRRHRATEFRQFLAQIDRASPPELALHLIVDNSSTHTTEAIRDFLAAHPRFHLHFTPTSASWLNAVETWFGQLERRALRRGVFTSVCRTAGGNPPLHRGSQHALCQTVPMDQVGPRYPRCCRTGAPIIASRNLPHGTLAAANRQRRLPDDGRHSPRRK